MFDLPHLSRNCQGVSRRALLRVGSLSLFGLSLPNWLAWIIHLDVRGVDGGRRREPRGEELEKV